MSQEYFIFFAEDPLLGSRQVVSGKVRVEIMKVGTYNLSVNPLRSFTIGKRQTQSMTL